MPTQPRDRPLNEEFRILRIFLLLVTTIAALYLLGLIWGTLGAFSDILLLVFLAWLLSFILEPWVTGFTRAGVARPVAAGLVYLVVAGMFILAGLIVIPLLANQTSSFIAALALSTNEPPRWVTELQQNLAASGIALDLNSLVRQETASFQAFSTATLTSTVTLAASLFSILIGAFLVLIFSFYFVIDGERLWQITLDHLPIRYHDELIFVKRAVSTSFSGFLRTQVLLGLLMGMLTYLTLLGFGVEFAVTAATFAGLSMIVPVIGPLLSILPPVLVTLVTQPDRTLVVFVILLTLQAVVVNVIGPLLFKRSIGIHPVVVLVSFLMGLRLAGVWGAIFAVPIAGVVLIIGSQLLQHWFGPGRSAPELDWPR